MRLYDATKTPNHVTVPRSNRGTIYTRQRSLCGNRARFSSLLHSVVGRNSAAEKRVYSLLLTLYKFVKRDVDNGQSNLAKGDMARMHKNPHFGEGEVVEGQRWYYSKELLLSIVTIALSLTIRLQFAVHCLSPTLKTIGVGQLGREFGQEVVADTQRYIFQH